MSAYAKATARQSSLFCTTRAKNCFITSLPSRSSLREIEQAEKMSAYAKATARQSSLFCTTRAKTGGKGIRTPDFQLAKLALYQLSYAPVELSILDCGSRIANAMGAYASLP